MEQAERAQLVERHLGLAQKAARLVFPRVRQHIELEELVALANVGLAEAAQRFDPTRGVPFSAFAWYRVQGSIVDGLRRATNLPRRVWLQLVALRAASDYLEHRGERDAGAAHKAIAAPSGADALAAMKSAMSAIRTMYLTSLEGMRDAGFDPAAETPDVNESLDRAALGKRLREAIAALPEREHALMTKHYFEGKNLLEAGAELGISKSWASRLHGQIVDKLRMVVDGEPPRPPP